MAVAVIAAPMAAVDVAVVAAGLGSGSLCLHEHPATSGSELSWNTVVGESHCALQYLKQFVHNSTHSGSSSGSSWLQLVISPGLNGAFNQHTSLLTPPSHPEGSRHVFFSCAEQPGTRDDVTQSPITASSVPYLPMRSTAIIVSPLPIFFLSLFFLNTLNCAGKEKEVQKPPTEFYIGDMPMVCAYGTSLAVVCSLVFVLGIGIFKTFAAFALIFLLVLVAVFFAGDPIGTLGRIVVYIVNYSSLLPHCVTCCLAARFVMGGGWVRTWIVSLLVLVLSLYHAFYVV